MTEIAERAGQLYIEDVCASELAEQFGTPLYAYSRAHITQQWQALDQAFSGLPHRLCYAVKANSNLAVLSVLAKLGASFDIVSLGELERVLAVGVSADRIVFSGVGKSRDEITRALQLDIACFNIESAAELTRIEEIARANGARARISLRVNPDVDAKTHPYISTGLKENKFGVPWQDARALYQYAAQVPEFDLVGIDCHIGSQLTEVTPYADALARLLTLVDQLKQDGINLKHIDLGGGLGVRYKDETPISVDHFAQTLISALSGRDTELWLEPGRMIVANAGVLLTRIEYLKENSGRHFAVVDASMSELIRPALYGAWQEISAVSARPECAEQLYDVVGPVCESSDFLGKQRPLQITAGDLLAVHSAGAYSFGMASNYNSRPRPAEVLVDGQQVHLARARETHDQLWALERPL